MTAKVKKYCYIFKNMKTGEFRKYFGTNYSMVAAKRSLGIKAVDNYDWKLIQSSTTWAR